MTHVLYIEDDEDVRNAFMRFFRIQCDDWIVTATDSADDAIAILSSLNFDIVISDYNIKNGTGGDVLRWIKENQPRLEDRFVFVSSDDEVEKHKYHMKKPVRPTALVDYINTCFGVT